jgi:cysteine-rich repeat protein
MYRLRSLWLVAPVFLGACSLINAPADIKEGTTGGTGGAAGTGGGGAGTSGASGTMTTSSTPDECGDGKVTGAEGCDDDNTKASDGCSAACAVEPGFECTGEPSSCRPQCGNGVVDQGEECDDMAQGDTNQAPGNQDYCNETCLFKEFDIEAAMEAQSHHQMPTAGFREDDGAPAFAVLWYSSLLNRIIGRQYKFDGTYLKGTGTVDISTSPKPDVGGYRLCTAESKRSIIFWRDADEGLVYARKIESDGTFIDPLSINTSSPEANPSCAVSAAGAFIGVVNAPSGALWDIHVQPFTSFAAPSGMPIDIGDANGPSRTSAWPLSVGYLVAWVADPVNNGPLRAQQLDKDGKLMPNMVYQISDIADVAPREPWGERIGTQDQFAVAYTRESMPDGMGMTHREVALAIFQSPGNGTAPLPVSADMNPQREPRIGVNPKNGKFVVAWTGGPPSAENIYLRAFDTAGKEVSAEKIVNENQVGQQTASSVAVDPTTGSVAIVWDNFVPNSGKPRKVSAKIFAGLLK